MKQCPKGNLGLHNILRSMQQSKIMCRSQFSDKIFVIFITCIVYHDNYIGKKIMNNRHWETCQNETIKKYLRETGKYNDE